LSESGSLTISSTFPCWAAKVSEMYLRKIRPRTRCLYSAASIWARSLSAVAQSTALKSLAGASFFALPRPRLGAGSSSDRSDASRSSRPPRSSPRSSSSASGVAKVAESVTRSGHFRPFSPAGLGFARYAVLAWFWMECLWEQREQTLSGSAVVLIIVISLLRHLILSNRFY